MFHLNMIPEDFDGANVSDVERPFSIYENIIYCLSAFLNRETLVV